MKIVKVNTSSGKYDILINAEGKREQFLSSIEKSFKEIGLSDNSSPIIIKDKNLDYSSDVESLLIEKYGAKVIKLTVSDEDVKTFKNLENIVEQILETKPTRKSFIIAIGGGSVGDFAGFLSSIILRGVRFIQIPTTLLSMVDSSVGGKNAINTSSAKNMIGTIYQPKLVICDSDYIKTLSQREYLCGYAEVLKYSLILDKKFFDFLLQNESKIIRRDSDFLSEIVYTSCKIKAKVVEKDEFETNGLRSLLNFGHTFGHAIEKNKSFKYMDGIKHGEAVAIGMLMAMEISQIIGYIGDAEVMKIYNHYKRVGLPYKISTENKLASIADEMINVMSMDKKNAFPKFATIANSKGDVVKIREYINLILLDKIGKAVNIEVEGRKVYDFVKEFLLMEKDI